MGKGAAVGLQRKREINSDCKVCYRYTFILQVEKEVSLVTSVNCVAMSLNYATVQKVPCAEQLLRTTAGKSRMFTFVPSKANLPIRLILDDELKVTSRRLRH